IRRADLGARRLLAVHADDGHRLDAVAPADELKMDHRLAAVRVAFGARLHARLAPDAAVRIDEEMQVVGFRHGYCCGSRRAAYAGAASARRTRQPHTLYCGILLIGSCAATVRRFALFSPVQ